MSIGHIYFARAIGTNFYKIGQTKGNPKNRIKELSTGCPYPLKLIRSIRVSNMDKSEKKYHDIFSHLRTHGEWFDIPDPSIVIDAIDTKSSWQPAENIDIWQDDRLYAGISDILYHLSDENGAGRLVSAVERIADALDRLAPKEIPDGSWEFAEDEHNEEISTFDWGQS